MGTAGHPALRSGPSGAATWSPEPAGNAAASQSDSEEHAEEPAPPSQGSPGHRRHPAPRGAACPSGSPQRPRRSPPSLPHGPPASPPSAFTHRPRHVPGWRRGASLRRDDGELTHGERGNLPEPAPERATGSPPPPPPPRGEAGRAPLRPRRRRAPLRPPRGGSLPPAPALSPLPPPPC